MPAALARTLNRAIQSVKAWSGDDGSGAARVGVASAVDTVESLDTGVGTLVQPASISNTTHTNTPALRATVVEQDSFFITPILMDSPPCNPLQPTTMLVWQGLDSRRSRSAGGR